MAANDATTGAGGVEMNSLMSIGRFASAGASSDGVDLLAEVDSARSTRLWSLIEWLTTGEGDLSVRFCGSVHL